MRNKDLTLVPITLSGLVCLAAAAPALAGSDKQFGCTVRQNIEVQTVDMNPQYQGTLVEGGVGQRSASAVRRYMIDKVRPLASFDGRSEVGRQGGAARSGDPAGTGTGTGQ